MGITVFRSEKKTRLIILRQIDLKTINVGIIHVDIGPPTLLLLFDIVCSESQGRIQLSNQHA